MSPSDSASLLQIVRLVALAITAWAALISCPFDARVSHVLDGARWLAGPWNKKAVSRPTEQLRLLQLGCACPVADWHDPRRV